MQALVDWSNTKMGSVVVSAVLGVGLASVFRMQCVGDHCVVQDAPSVRDMRRFIYEVDDKCYKYDVQRVDCDRAKTGAKA